MEVLGRKRDLGYFRLSKKSPTHEFCLLIPGQLRTGWTFMQLRQLFGTDPQTKLSYIFKPTGEPTAPGLSSKKVALTSLDGAEVPALFCAG